MQFIRIPAILIPNTAAMLKVESENGAKIKDQRG